MAKPLAKKKKKQKKKWQKGSVALISGSLPFLGATSVAFLSAFGAMNFINFFYLGTVALTAGAIAGPFLPLVLLLTASMFLMIYFEARPFYLFANQQLNDYLEYDNEPLLEANIETPPALLLATKILCGTIAILAPIAKGMAASIATIATLAACFSFGTGVALSALGIGSLVALGPVGVGILAVGVLAGLVVFGVSLGKEGRNLYNQSPNIAQWIYTSFFSQEPQHPGPPNPISQARAYIPPPKSMPPQDTHLDRWLQEKSNTHAAPPVFSMGPKPNLAPQAAKISDEVYGYQSFLKLMT